MYVCSRKFRTYRKVIKPSSVTLMPHRACISCSVVSDSFRPHGLWPTLLLCPWDSPGRKTGVGYHFLLQGIFSAKGSNHISCVSFIIGRFFTCWSTSPIKCLLIFSCILSCHSYICVYIHTYVYIRIYIYTYMYIFIYMCTSLIV